jgi:type I restriction-modification system DNA methylase subunit
MLCLKIVSSRGNWIGIIKLQQRTPYNRFRFGIPPEKDKADFAFIQHFQI